MNQNQKKKKKGKKPHSVLGLWELNLSRQIVGGGGHLD